MEPFLFGVHTAWSLVGAQQVIFFIEAFKCLEHTFCRPVLSIVLEHGKHFLQDVGKYVRRGFLTALLDLFLDLRENVNAVVDIDEAMLPLFLNLLLFLDDVTPLLLQPGCQFGHHMLNAGKRVGRMTESAHKLDILGTLWHEAGVFSGQLVVSTQADP